MERNPVMAAMLLLWENVLGNWFRDNKIALLREERQGKCFCYNYFE